MAEIVHMPPKYHGYRKGTFANITECGVCGTTALYEDMHPAKPCPHCGSKVRESGAGKWIPDVVVHTYDLKGFFKGLFSFKKTEVISKGYWEKA